VAVGLEVDAPRVARDQPGLVIAQRLVRVDVEDRRGEPIVGREQRRIDYLEREREEVGS